MTLLYGARYSLVLLKLKNKVNLLRQSAVQKIGFVWENGLYHVGRFCFSGFKKAPDAQIFQGLHLLPMRSLKRLSKKDPRGTEKNKCCLKNFQFSQVSGQIKLQ